MAQERLKQWALRMIPDGDGSEGKVKRIRCQTDTQILDTWDAPFAGRETWCDEAEALIAAHAEQLPVRRHAILFTAEDSGGTILSQCTTHCMGRNKDAAEIGVNNGAKALTDAMNGIAQTVNTVLGTARQQCESLGKTVETLSEQVQDLVELHKAKTEKEIAETEMGSQVASMFIQKLDEFGPPLLELGKLYLTSKNNPSAVSAIVQAAANGATTGKAAAS